MKKRNLTLLIAGLTVMAAVVFSYNAFAGRYGMGMYGRGPGFGAGSGYGRGMGMYGQYGTGPGYGRGYCSGIQGYGLSEDEIGKLENERAAFLKETETLRNDMYQKRLELNSELAKETPDIETARKLQKEISDLRSQLDQKRMDHMVSLKKINPNVGRGFMSRGPRGLHRGPHRW